MKDSVAITPNGKNILESLGENIKLARLRRKLKTEQIAENAGISRKTLWQIEKGISTVTIGAYFQVLYVLGLEADFLKLASDDDLGHKIQDAGLLTKKSAPKTKILKMLEEQSKV